MIELKAVEFFPSISLSEKVLMRMKQLVANKIMKEAFIVSKSFEENRQIGGNSLSFCLEDTFEKYVFSSKYSILFSNLYGNLSYTIFLKSFCMESLPTVYFIFFSAKNCRGKSI